jgi:hypothetical protein
VEGRGLRKRFHKAAHDNFHALERHLTWIHGVWEYNISITVLGDIPMILII